MGLLAHAVRGVPRNARRSLSAVLGTMLVVAVLAGENIAIDSSAKSLWQSAEEVLPSHFQGYGPLNGTAALREDLQDVPAFAEVAAFTFAPFQVTGPPGWPADLFVQFVFQDFDRAFPYLNYRGTLVLGGDNVTMTSGVAEQAGLFVGDDFALNLTITFPGANATFTAPYTFRVASIVTPETAPGGTILGGAPNFQVLYLDAAWLDAQLVAWNITLPPGFSLLGVATYYGWLDSDSLVDPFDVDKSKARVRRVMRDIEGIASLHSVWIFSDGQGPSGTTGSTLEVALDFYGTFSSILRIIFLMVSLPVIVLGLYLGAIGIDLGMAERRREIGLLKARGAQNRQIFLSLLVESFLLAALAAIGGILLGIGVSQVFLSLGPSALFGAAPPAFAITGVTIAMAVTFALAFQILVAFRPFRRASVLTVSEGLSHYTPGEVRLEYSPTRDITYVLLGTFVFVYQVLLTGGEGFLRFILTLVFGVLTLFAPFLLALGATRLLTRASPRLYEKAARVAKPFTGVLFPLVHRNLARNPRRAGNIATIMTLALVFGLMITTLYASQVAFQERAIRADIGGDVRIDSLAGTTVPEDITAVPGVALVARVRSVDAPPYTVIAFDAANYTAIVQQDDAFLLEGGWEGVRSVAAPNRVLINEAVAKEEAIARGEILRVPASGLGGPSGEMINLLVVGVVRALPGLHQNPLAFDSATTPYIYLDESNLQSTGPSAPVVHAVWFLVKASAGVDPGALGDRLAAVDPYGWRVRVAHEEIASALADPLVGAFLRLIAMQIAFCILIVTAGLGLILYTASLERKAEFAGMAARGASRRQVASILLGEAWVIICIGLLIGSVLGALSGWVFLLTFTRNTASLLPPTFAFGWESVAVIAATVASMFLTAAVIAWRAGGPDVVDVLRERGG